MPTDVYSVTIKKPIEMVFNYITTPAWWPIYHPTSKKVEPFVKSSLGVGENATETCVLDPAGFVKFVIDWTGTENDGRTLFRMEGNSDSFTGADGTITYELSETDEGTLFKRTFEYELGGIFGKLFEAQAKFLDDVNRLVHPTGEDELGELQSHSGPPISIIAKAIEKDGVDALDNVKAILESMPC
jgi:hypothetical protein